MKRVYHQLSLFGFQRPSCKVPISKERIEQAKAHYMKGDTRTAVDMLREVRYGLENYAKRIHQKKYGFKN